MAAITEPVVLVPEHHRYEMRLGDAVAFIDYRREGTIVALTHAEVPAALNGRGIGSALVRGTLELIKAAGEQVRPLCSFVAAYMAQHPEYEGLRAAPRR
ncbi:MAG: GNAT family N-acetyltransferase [Steroidobacteraceae bacterium]|jgi:predicted GNAT family acetyltransferase